MNVMGTPLRKISLKDGLTAAALAAALTAGLAIALRSSGHDIRQATDAMVPVFVGGLAQAAGINPVRSPLLLGIVGLCAALVMLTCKWALGTL